MNYQEWLKNGWLRPHPPTPEEIAGLRAVVERDLKASADPNLDGDWRFAIAYNAALQCAAMAFLQEEHRRKRYTAAVLRTLDARMQAWKPDDQAQHSTAGLIRIPRLTTDAFSTELHLPTEAHIKE